MPCQLRLSSPAMPGPVFCCASAGTHAVAALRRATTHVLSGLPRIARCTSLRRSGLRNSSVPGESSDAGRTHETPVAPTTSLRRAGPRRAQLLGCRARSQCSETGDRAAGFSSVVSRSPMTARTIARRASRTERRIASDGLRGGYRRQSTGATNRRRCTGVQLALSGVEPAAGALRASWRARSSVDTRSRLSPRARRSTRT